MTVFLIPSFFILHSLFFPTPARAEITCPDGGVVQDSSVPEEWQCCNYASSPNHIPQPDPEGRCNEDHCKRETFPGSFPYGGECKYCNPLVTVRKDGCSGCGCTCNQACAGAPPLPEECPLPDYPTDRCCPLAEIEITTPSLPEEILNAILNAVLNASIIFREDELRHAHVEELKLRYYGGEDGEGSIMRSLMPPNNIYIQEKAERERVDGEWGGWGFKTEGMPEDTEEVLGADWYLYKLNYADEFLSILSKIPGQEESQSSLMEWDDELCNPTRISINLADALARAPNQEEVSGTVLAAGDEDLCHDILPGPKHGACVAQREVSISTTQALKDILGRKVKIFPSFSFLRNIFYKTLGSGAEGEPAGFFRIFDLPGEEHEKFDGETEKGLFAIQFSINLPAGFDITLPPINVESKMEGVWNTGTVAYGDFTIQEKLSPPWAYVPPPTEGEPEPYEPPSEPVDYELTPEEIQRARELGLDPELVARASSVSAWAARRGWSIDRGILIALTDGESANCTNCGRSDAETAYRSRGWPEQITILKKALEHWEEYNIRAANSRAAYYVNESYTAALGSSAGALGCSQFLIGTAWPHRHKVSDPSFDLWDKTTAMQTMAAELHRLGWRENASLTTKISVLLGWNRHYSWVSSIVRTAQYILAYLDAAGI